MRRVLLVLCAALLLAAAAGPLAAAGKPAQTCAAAQSGYSLVNRNEWWDITVAGFEAEGITVYESHGTIFTAESDEFAAAAGLVMAWHRGVRPC